MAPLDVQVVAVRPARVAFVTRTAGRHGGTQGDRPFGERSQMPRVGCECVIRERPEFETMHPHAGLIPAMRRLPLELPLTSADRPGRRPSTPIFAIRRFT